MIKVGLTGSIGMGKSTVAAMFEDEGIPVFDADAVVHALQGPGGCLVPAIEAAFPGVTTAAGVDRLKLGNLVFASPELLDRLESIVHPAVALERARFVQRHRSASLIVFDIPLLFEKGRETELDAVVVVSATSEIQRRRVLARPAMTQAKLDRILALQMPDARKCESADFVIDTSAAIEATRDQVRKVIACLNAREGR